MQQKLDNCINEKQKLENEVTRLRSLIKAIPDLVWMKDIDGIYLFCNSKFERFFGVKESEIVGKKDTDFVSAEQAGYFIQKDKEAIDANRPLINTYWINYADDGHREFIETIKTPLYDENGNLIGILGVGRDITGRFFEKKDINKFMLGIENSSEGIFITDVNGNIDFINPAFEKIYGYSREETLGKTPRILKSGLISSEEYRKTWDTLLSGKSVNHEIVNSRKDGSLIYIEASDNPILDEMGNVAGFLSINHDITGRKVAEQELTLAKEKAEESNRLKTAFLNNISHEIRTPLNAINGFSALLTAPGNSCEEQAMYVETIRKSSDHLLAIVSDIIDISSIEAKAINTQIIKVNLNSRLEKLYKQFLGSAHTKKIALSYKTELPSERADVMSDQIKFDRIMSNLLNNAIKFTLEGNIVFGYVLKDSFIEFFVKDSGIGIPAEFHRKIFENFYQVEYSTNRKFEGTGLGLSISKALVENMGGEIRLKSEVGKGSTFYFTVPYVDASPKVKISVTDNPALSASFVQKTVLVAEDDKDNFSLIKTFLEKLGYNVKHAFNGSEAVEMCRADMNIELIIMDVNMPVMNGYNATRLIREFRSDVVIIAQTAYYDDREVALKSGCNDFISKPFSKEVFNSIIKENMSRKLVTSPV